MKKIIASLALGLVLATAGMSTIIGCSTSNNNGGSGGTGGGGSGGTGGSGGSGNADMSFVCVPNPTSDPDFLNSCPPASVTSVDIEPFYPAMAPGGVLPPIQ
jgi:hypothetical protein